MFAVIAALIVGAFMAAPLVIVFPMSFSTGFTYAFPPPGYWLGYYKVFFTSDAWLESILNSLIIGTGTTIVTMLLVVPLSIGYVRYKFSGKKLVNQLILFPLIVPAIVSALGYFGFLANLGLVGTHLGVIIAHSAAAIPISFLVLSAALKGFDRNLERAAMGLGSGPLRTFLWVTLPILWPGIAVGALFAFLSSFNDTVVAIFISGRNAGTLPKKMWESIQFEADPVMAVVSTLLTGVVLIGVLVPMLLRQRRTMAQGNAV